MKPLKTTRTLLPLYDPTDPYEYSWSPMPKLLSRLTLNRTTRPPADASSFTSVTTTAIVETLTQFVSTFAFWTAVALPVLYLPLLIAGLNTTTDLLVFLTLFALHLITLIAGHSHLTTSA